MMHVENPEGRHMGRTRNVSEQCVANQQCKHSLSNNGLTDQTNWGEIPEVLHTQS